MNERPFVELSEPDGTLAMVAPELGGWLLRYARPMAALGLTEALHYSPEVVDRYPREMYAGSPILFPFAGSNRVGEREHCYEWNGQSYEMPQHGFGRRSRWSVVSQESSAVTLELVDTAATRVQYPFAFRQRLRYALANGRLHWEQVIENQSAALMPFSTGFHPYFRVPLAPGSDRAACFVELPEGRRLYPQGRHERFTAKPFPDQNWSVAEDVAGSIFLTDLRQREVLIVDPISELEVVFNFEDAPQHRFLVLWSKAPTEPFFCVEPWTALPNAFSRQSRDHELILLEPQQTFRAAMWMELRRLS